MIFDLELLQIPVKVAPTETVLCQSVYSVQITLSVKGELTPVQSATQGIRLTL